MLSKYKFELTKEQWETFYKFTTEEFQEAENCTRKKGTYDFPGVTASWYKENPLSSYAELEPIKKLFIEASYHYFENVYGVKIPHHTDLTISDSWFVTAEDPGIDRPYILTGIHNHPFSMCSGIFYMDDSEHGTTFFSNVKKPHWPFMWEKNEDSNYDPETFFVKAEKGTLLLFPSDITHSATILKGAQKRHAVAFNIWPMGNLSEQENANLNTGDNHLPDTHQFWRKIATFPDFSEDDS